MKTITKKISLKSSRKGITYMIISSFIIVVLLTVFFTGNFYGYQDKEDLYQTRIRSMNDFVNNFNKDAYRASYIAGYRSLLSLEDYVARTSTFLNDTNASFKEVFYYGTINNSEVSIMENSSFEDYLTSVNTLSKQVGINISVNVTNIRLMQYDPWTIRVIVVAKVNITDTKGLASWEYTKDYVTYVPIYDLENPMNGGLRDPLYSHFTLNKVPNTIKRLNTTTLVNGSNVTNLNTIITGSYYIASTYAPSFLMRFEGRTSNDTYGIESIVSIKYLSDQDLEVYPDRVKIDYIYFNNITTDKICNVTNVTASSYFVIPSNRIDLYQINNSLLNYTTLCP